MTETIGGYPAVGYDIDFLTIGQVGEFDRRRYEAVLKAMLRSFTIADEDE